ncbi:hypothetical protein, partial [Marinobacter sp. C1S70]|uniref:hypothetical protein n=1 Tax=Marinobacter sp. C1S70 TaxID=1396859 RepID=UPI00056B362E
HVRRNTHPDHIYRKVRKKGLFILHLVIPKVPDDEKELRNQICVPSEVVVGWGMSLPRSLHAEETVEYVVNAVRYKELFGDEDEDEDQESDDDSNN